MTFDPRDQALHCGSHGSVGERVVNSNCRYSLILRNSFTLRGWVTQIAQICFTAEPVNSIAADKFQAIYLV